MGHNPFPQGLWPSGRDTKVKHLGTRARARLEVMGILVKH